MDDCLKILWVCNLPTKDACFFKKSQILNQGGWLSSMSKMLADHPFIELSYCYPALGKKEQDDFVFEKIHYYSFYTSRKFGFLPIDADKTDSLKVLHLKKIIDTVKPDIVHIFGTEYSHAYIVADIVENKLKLVCSIQGLVSVYERHFLAFIPHKIGVKVNMSCLFRKTLIGQQKQLERRGKREIATLNLCKNVIGRTDWDRACTYFINPHRVYHKCNETLRSSFYNNEWVYENCKKNTIFMSQASSPLKGLNVLLEAIHFLADELPDISLKVAGNDFVKAETVKARMKRSTYGSYIASLIKKYHLEKNVIFLGALGEEQMVKEYLACNVFVSPSSIENSSNSIGEAMLLGVPVISSDVGGVKSLLLDGQEGFLYQGDAPYMLAMMLKNIFFNPHIGMKIGHNARKRAMCTHDPLQNRETLIEIYRKIDDEICTENKENNMNI